MNKCDSKKVPQRSPEFAQNPQGFLHVAHLVTLKDESVAEDEMSSSDLFR